MTRDYIVLDLETRESFREVGGWNPEKLTISLVGLSDARTGAERVFRCEELPALEELLKERPTVVGFNLFGFDYAVLRPAFATLNPYALPTVDLFDHLQRELGFRPKLDDLAAATLGRRKSGTGLEAIRLYQAGDWEALARYCLDDVRITRDLFEYGRTHGYVKINTCRSPGESGPLRAGTIAEVKATWVSASAEPACRTGRASADKPVPAQARMF